MRGKILLGLLVLGCIAVGTVVAKGDIQFDQTVQVLKKKLLTLPPPPGSLIDEKAGLAAEQLQMAIDRVNAVRGECGSSLPCIEQYHTRYFFPNTAQSDPFDATRTIVLTPWKTPVHLMFYAKNNTSVIRYENLASDECSKVLEQVGLPTTPCPSSEKKYGSVDVVLH